MRRTLVGSVVLAALLLTQPAFAQALAPIPGMNVDVKDIKIHNVGAPIVELYRANEAERRCRLTSWMDDMLARYGEGKDRELGKIRVSRLANQLKEEDLDDVRRYASWLTAQDRVGTNFQVTGRFLRFPEGLNCLVRPALSRYDDIVAVLGSVDGGGTWNPGVYVKGKGWGIPFTAKQLCAGGKEFMSLVIDRSNRKQIRVFVLNFGTKFGIGEQWVPYQFEVTDAVYKNGRHFDVARMTIPEIVRHCAGVNPPWTDVTPDEESPVATKVEGEESRDEKRDAKRQIGHQEDKQGDERDRRSTRREPETIDITVEAEDCNQVVLSRDVRATLKSYAAGRLLDSQDVTVTGPTLCKVKIGDEYAVCGYDRTVVLVPMPGDRVDGDTVYRKLDRDGNTRFVLREKRVERVEQPRRATRHDDETRDDEDRTRDRRKAPVEREIQTCFTTVKLVRPWAKSPSGYSTWLAERPVEVTLRIQRSEGEAVCFSLKIAANCSSWQGKVPCGRIISLETDDFDSRLDRDDPQSSNWAIGRARTGSTTCVVDGEEFVVLAPDRAVITLVRRGAR